MDRFKVVATTGVYEVKYNPEALTDGYYGKVVITQNDNKVVIDVCPDVGDNIHVTVAREAMDEIKLEYTEINGFIVGESNLPSFTMAYGDDYDIHFSEEL